MSKEEIKEYLKRIDELGNKLTGKDKETYAWLIYGFNQCAKWLNETEQQVEKQKEVIILKYYEDLKIKDISKILDEKVPTIKSRLKQGIEKLSRYLGKEDF